MTEAGMLVVVGGVIVFICFSSFVTYKAQQKKKLLRKRVKVLNNEHLNIGRNLHEMVRSGELVAVT